MLFDMLEREFHLFLKLGCLAIKFPQVRADG